MRSSFSRRLWNGLGLLLVGAILYYPARLGAQVRDTIIKRPDSVAIRIAPGADSLLRDSLARRDSMLARIRRDTIKAPITHAEIPVEVGIGQTLRWDRDSIYATGAITLADLLDRVQGVTVYRAGWIGAPTVANYQADFRKVRVFFDGVEWPVLDPRLRGTLDLTQVPIWNAEQIVLEQAPEEIRVYIRTWRVRSTTAVTRTDVNTGDQQTNLYRGYFGRRYRGGGVFQFAAQQFGTTPPSILGNSADQLGLMLRGGWAGRHLSVDGLLMTNGRHRGVIESDPIFGQPGDSIPTIQSSRLDGYLRVGMGDPDTSRAWAQVLAVGMRYQYTGIRSFTRLPTTVAESLLANAPLDSGLYRTQYIASAGVGRGPLRLSAAGRVYAGAGQTLIIPAVRASFQMSPLTLSAFAEGRAVDSVARADLTAQVTPLKFLSFIGSGGIASSQQIVDSGYTTRYARGEAGVRLFDLWFTGGVLWRDSTRIGGPVVFDTLFSTIRDGSATALTAGIRGRVWRAVHADISAIRWTGDSLGFYRPRYQTRSELYIRTNLLERFPTNDFGFLFSAVHEYRSGVLFPINGVPNLRAVGYRTFSTLLEIRILSATLTWQFRNFLGERYSQVPFFLMPRQTNYYGVRWEFFN